MVKEYTSGQTVWGNVLLPRRRRIVAAADFSTVYRQPKTLVVQGAPQGKILIPALIPTVHLSCKSYAIGENCKFLGRGPGRLNFCTKKDISASENMK